MTDPTLFDQSDDAHARRSDPVSSHLTNQSLGKDTSTKALIWTMAAWWSRNHGTPMNDTLLTELLEHHTGGRFQRNVVARSRDLMTDDGWFIKVDMRTYHGRTLVHFIPNPTKQGDH